MMIPAVFKMMPAVFKMLWRDARSGELNVLVASIVVAVVIVTSISLFSERLQKALVSEASVFLAADLVLQSSEPVDENWLSDPSAALLKRAEIVQFPSMVYANNDMVLSSVKAVSDAYPLLGNLEISEEAFTVGQKVIGGPRPGEAWLDSRLLSLLNVHLGDKVWIGEKTFVVRKILTREPDSGSSYWSLGPRILINLSDLQSTQVILPGSRVEYRYLFSSSDKKNIDAYTEWLKARLQKSALKNHSRVMTLQDSQPGLSQSLERAEHFLLLAGSLGVLLASIAIALAARRYSLRHFDAVAIMKTLGATPSFLSNMVLVHIAVILVSSVCVGWILGGFIQYAFLYVMRHWLPAVLPAASFKPYVTGAMTGIICTLIFALPLLWHLRKVPPLRVLRRELGNEAQSLRSFYAMGATAIFLLMFYYSQSIRLTIVVYGGTLLCAAIVTAMAWLLLNNLRWFGIYWQSTHAGSVWRLALANLRRNQWQSLLQMVMFGLVLMLLLISILIRTSIVSEWQKQLPEKTPNHFLINIAPYQVEPVKQLLLEKNILAAGMHPVIFYPMVRGRLTEINGVEATTIISESVDEVYRELNLTWSDTLPDDNTLVSGQWWLSKIDSQQALSKVSIEKSLAKKLNVKVGDQLTFMVGDQTLKAMVSSVRELSWDKMRPNFYFIFEPSSLDNFPATYITSFYLPKSQKLFLNTLLKRFPTVSIFEIDEMISRIQKMVTQVTQAIELVLGLILVAGALVLIATVQASLDQRLYESALLRTLGAGKKRILGSLAIEFVLLGVFAGFMAALGGEITAWALQTQVFKIDYHFHLWLWLMGPITGAAIIGLLGVMACIKVIRVSPLILLREQ